MKKPLAFTALFVSCFLTVTPPAFAERDLETGVFLSRDPAGFVDGPNLYGYVQQNPWTHWDPEGLMKNGERHLGGAGRGGGAGPNIGGGSGTSRYYGPGNVFPKSAQMPGAARPPTNSNAPKPGNPNAPKPPEPSNPTGSSRTTAKENNARTNGETQGSPKPSNEGNAGKKGEIEWTNEGHGNPAASKYEAGAPGNVPGKAPRLRATDAEGSTTAKFDGVDGKTMIDRKLSVTTFPKSEHQMLRQSATAAENGYGVRWEVPNPAQQARAQKMAESLGVRNIDVQVVPE